VTSSSEAQPGGDIMGAGGFVFWFFGGGLVVWIVVTGRRERVRASSELAGSLVAAERFHGPGRPAPPLGPSR
jgi:hypothetical protein